MGQSNATTGRPVRVLVAKPGLDGHDKGAKVVARALRDAGCEVIYTGLHQTIDQIVEAALQEDVDVIGLSILSDAHMPLTEKLVAHLAESNMTEVKILVGGNIPERDIEPLLKMGVARVFPTGSRLDEISAYVKGISGGD